MNSYGILEILESWINQPKSRVFKTLIIEIDEHLFHIEDFNSIIRGVSVITSESLNSKEFYTLHNIFSYLSDIHLMVNDMETDCVNNVLVKYSSELYLNIDQLKSIARELRTLEVESIMSKSVGKGEDLPF